MENRSIEAQHQIIEGHGYKTKENKSFIDMVSGS